MAIKEIPTNYRQYYDRMKKNFTQKREELIEEYYILKTETANRRNAIEKQATMFKSLLNIDVTAYEEFNTNDYKTGMFYRRCKNLLISKREGHENIAEALELYTLAKLQKDAMALQSEAELYNKCIKVTCDQYRELLLTFYTEVHKKMIIEGAGYKFAGRLGWICINRCKLRNPKRHVDWAKTKEKKKEILESGGKVYDKEEAAYYESIGLEYDGQDGRVYQQLEYIYEIPLIDCSLPHHNHYRFEPNNSRNRETRTLKNEELAEKCNNDLNKICELNFGIKHKLNTCLIADSHLYTKFIRNENQKPYADRAAYWKVRQRFQSE